MAKYNPVATIFWGDKDVEDLPPNGKLLLLFLITNHRINNSGIYEITIKKISQETGLTVEFATNFLEKNKLKNITYDFENSMVFVHNRRIYSPGGKPENVEKGINQEYKVSSKSFLWKLFNDLYPAILKDFVNRCPTVAQPLPNRSIPLPLPLPIDLNNNKPLKIEGEILETLNQVAGKNYKPTDANLNFIKARLAEGYTQEDCEAVIKNRVAYWKDDAKMAEFIRPATLFCKKNFPGYLNAPPPGSNGNGRKKTKMDLAIEKLQRQEAENENRKV